MTDSKSSVVGTWALRSCTSEPAESTFVLGHNTEGFESALADDTRRPVDDKDVQPGGKYYSIVKLQIRYENQDAADDRWAQGSGWLIKPDLLVTAGHCAFDHSEEKGRAAQVKCWVGYKGRDSTGAPGVQFRHVKRILTTSAWLKDPGNRENDVAFMVLEQPFANVVPIKWQPTPVTATMKLGVVGYPADKTYKGEAGAQMYAQFKETTYDLKVTGLNMLEYTISSYGGQSGSPVLVEGSNTAIGTHVYGLGTKNAGSVIRGKYGNFYRSYMGALEGKIQPPQPNQQWTVLQTPAVDEATGDVKTAEAEDFWGSLKNVVDIGTKVGSIAVGTALPLLGPIGGPISAVVGGALGVLGKATDSAMMGSSVSSDAIVPGAYQDTMCRAIASEAALSAVLRMDPVARGLEITHSMESYVEQYKDMIPALARTITPAIMSPAQRLAESAQSTHSAARNAPIPALPKPVTDGQTDEWFEIVTTSIRTEEADMVDSDDLQAEREDRCLDVLKLAVRAGSAGINSAGRIINAGSAIGFDAGKSYAEPVSSDQRHIESLCHRALMGEAVLQAILRMPPDNVKRAGFFADILSKVKEISAPVLGVAPSVTRDVQAIADQLIQQYTNPIRSSDPLTRSKHSKESTRDLLRDESWFSQRARPPIDPNPREFNQSGWPKPISATTKASGFGASESYM